MPSHIMETGLWYSMIGLQLEVLMCSEGSDYRGYMNEGET